MTDAVPPASAPPRPPQMPGPVQAASIVWRDVRSVLGTITNTAIVALLISVFGDVLAYVIAATVDPGNGVAAIAAVVIGIVQVFLMTPYLIAIHRFIILGEVTNGYRLDPSLPRFQKFFGWSMLLLFSVMTLSVVVMVLPLPELGQVALVLAADIAVGFVMLRMALLFPAIAVDAPGATLANVWADTQGRAWDIFLIGLVTGLPLLGAVILLAIVVVVVTNARTGTPLEAAANGVVGVIVITLFVTLAARLYGWLGRKVKAPRA